MFLARFFIHLIDIYIFVIIISAVMSWFSGDPYNPVVLWISKVTDPFLNGIRRLIPTAGFGIDISPIIAIILLSLLKKLVIGVML